MAKSLLKVLGIIFVVLGVAGFFIQFDGLFSLTINHNIVHLLTGIIMLALSGTESRSIAGAKIFGFVYLLVTVLGLFVHDILGVVLLPADTILHLIITVALLVVGFKASSSVNVGASEKA